MKKISVTDAITGGLGIASSTASSLFAPASDANTGVGGALNGAMQGASMGAALGPIGMAAGAATGFLTSAFKKGNVTSGGFYGDPTMQKGGIFTNNRKLKKQYEMMKQTAAGNRVANTAGQELQAQFDEDNDDMIMAAAKGGMVGDMVLLNDGELIKTPDGKLSKTADLGLPVDSQLAYLPKGTQILNRERSKDILSRMNGSKNKDRFADGTNKVNNIIARTWFDDQFAQQEADKAKKGTKKKFKKFNEGGETGKKMPEIPWIANSIQEKLAPTALPETLDLRYDLPSALNPKYYRGNKAYIERNYGKDTTNTSNKFDWQNAITGLASAAPAISNLFASEAEPVRQVNNPYARTALNTLRRKYDNSAELNAARRNRAISNYNMRNINTGTGANIAYGLQSAINYDNMLSDIYARTGNINREWAGQYAQALDNFGRQYAGSANLAADLNAQNQANTRNIRRTGLSQLGQWAQTRELMKNQRNRDQQIMPMYQAFLDNMFTKDVTGGIFGI